MNGEYDLIKRINGKYSSMSKGHKAIANYITDYYDRAVFLTASRLGETCGVSETTVIRFAYFLGYKGYPEFHRALEDMVATKLQTAQTDVIHDGRSEKGLMSAVLKADAEKIEKTMEEIDENAFNTSVEAILDARRIYVIGLRSCAPLASLLAFYLGLVLDNVVLLQTTSTTELFEQMIGIGQEDVIIGISFPRYSMRTLKAMEFANSRMARVITITDSVNSPMNLYSSCNLIAKSSLTAVVDSLVAPLSVINALVVSICSKRQDEVVKRMDAIEQVWQDYQFYDNDEMSIVGDSIRMHYKDPREI